MLSAIPAGTIRPSEIVRVRATGCYRRTRRALPPLRPARNNAGGRIPTVRGELVLRQIKCDFPKEKQHDRIYMEISRLHIQRHNRIFDIFYGGDALRTLRVSCMFQRTIYVSENVSVCTDISGAETVLRRVQLNYIKKLAIYKTKMEHRKLLSQKEINILSLNKRF